MRTRFRLFAAAAAIVVLTGLLAGTASAGESGTGRARVAAPPAEEVLPNGTVRFTATKPGTGTQVPRLINCEVRPEDPYSGSNLVTFTTSVTCKDEVGVLATVEFIRMLLVIEEEGELDTPEAENWQFTTPFLSHYQSKACEAGRYTGRVFVHVTFPRGFTPPFRERTFWSNTVLIDDCVG